MAIGMSDEYRSVSVWVGTSEALPHRVSHPLFATFHPASTNHSFVFRRDSQLFNRRVAKIVTSIVSEFTSNFVFHWSCYFSNQKVRREEPPYHPIPSD